MDTNCRTMSDGLCFTSFPPCILNEISIQFNLHQCKIGAGTVLGIPWCFYSVIVNRTRTLKCWSDLAQTNLMAVFSVASGSSVRGKSSARISSRLRGSFNWGFCSLPLIPIPAVMAFHRALWDLDPEVLVNKCSQMIPFALICLTLGTVSLIAPLKPHSRQFCGT